jgi:predicted GH43/DUF377 family glycosyl hydrolase
LLTDTASQISFNSIPIGTWYLRIDALNASKVIVYTGSAAVDVSAGATTQVSVSMNAVTVTGNIQISLNWGTQSPWVDYPANPILASSGSAYETGGVVQPFILYDNGIYKMWFSSLGNSGVCMISYATSTDGFSWSRYASPLLVPDTAVSWATESICVGPVIKVNNEYRMYFNGWASQYGNWNIGLATSSDGIHWQCRKQPVLYGTSGDQYQIVATDIIKLNGKYILYYTGRNYPFYKIFAAVSDDGITWTKVTNPILTATQSWEGNGVFYSTVIQDGNTLRMAFMNDGQSAVFGFGFATSTDGLTWTKDSGNPFFTNVQTANHWTNNIQYPRLVLIGGKQCIYYTSLNSGIASIGVVRKQ